MGLVVSGLQLLDDGVIRVAPLFKSADSVEDSLPRLVVVVAFAIAHNGVALPPQVGYDGADGDHAACGQLGGGKALRAMADLILSLIKCFLPAKMGLHCWGSNTRNTGGDRRLLVHD